MFGSRPDLLTKTKNNIFAKEFGVSNVPVLNNERKSIKKKGSSLVRI